MRTAILKQKNLMNFLRNPKHPHIGLNIPIIEVKWFKLSANAISKTSRFRRMKTKKLQGLISISSLESMSLQVLS
jgi:hypothetical protein